MSRLLTAREVARLERRLTKAEYAEYLRCSPRWLEYRLAEGLPSEMIAGRRTARHRAVREWEQTP